MKYFYGTKQPLWLQVKKPAPSAKLCSARHRTGVDFTSQDPLLMERLVEKNRYRFILDVYLTLSLNTWQYCYGGECVSKKPPNPVKVIPGGWSQWKMSGCSSGCIEKSLGHQTKQRFCNNPTPVNTDQGCDGPSYSVGLCSDYKVNHKICLVLLARYFQKTSNNNDVFCCYLSRNAFVAKKKIQ